jgi:hypothetical protein
VQGCVYCPGLCHTSGENHLRRERRSSHRRPGRAEATEGTKRLGKRTVDCLLGLQEAMDEAQPPGPDHQRQVLGTGRKVPAGWGGRGAWHRRHCKGTGNVPGRSHHVLAAQRLAEEVEEGRTQNPDGAAGFSTGTRGRWNHHLNQRRSRNLKSRIGKEI